MLLVQIYNKNSTINIKITQLQVTCKIRNQLDIGLKATFAVTEVERGHEMYKSASWPADLVISSQTSLSLVVGKIFPCQ